MSQSSRRARLSHEQSRRAPTFERPALPSSALNNVSHRDIFPTAPIFEPRQTALILKNVPLRLLTDCPALFYIRFFWALEETISIS